MLLSILTENGEMRQNCLNWHKKSLSTQSLFLIFFRHEYFVRNNIIIYYFRVIIWTSINFHFISSGLLNFLKIASRSFAEFWLQNEKIIKIQLPRGAVIFSDNETKRQLFSWFFARKRPSKILRRGAIEIFDWRK